MFIDINNGNAPVVVVYRGDNTGLLTPVLLNPDGTPYTGVNPAFRIPSSGNLNVNTFPYCDAGTTKIKYIVTDNGVYLSDFAQLPDGTPTTISNTATVGSCEVGALLASINANVASIDAKTIKSDTDNVTVTNSALPTGASTEATLLNVATNTSDTNANVQLGNITLNNVETLLTSIDTSTNTIEADTTQINTKTPALIDGRTPVTNLDYGVEVARGNIPGVSFVTIRGYNAATSTTNEPIWAQSGTVYPNVTTAQTLTVSSNNAADNGAGTGAAAVAITYVRFSD